jgi:hypothetical protein
MVLEKGCLCAPFLLRVVVALTDDERIATT